LTPAFAGRVALVTGASGGIGSRLAEAVAAEGAAVALHYAHQAEAVETLAQQLLAAGTSAMTLAGDFFDADAPDRVIAEVEDALGPVDILCANHGRARPAHYTDVDAAAFDRTMAVNLRAPFLLARRVLPGMTERGWGRILFTSSVAGFTGGMVGPDYGASKAGLHAITHFLASRVAPDGVTVNAIAPALIEDTNMLPGDRGSLAGRVPVGRLGRPEEVADLAVAILRNGYMTSEVVGLDGGMYAR
jgi:3-oxoacyl-[acyl-carrier protein] reductase